MGTVHGSQMGGMPPTSFSKPSMGGHSSAGSHTEKGKNLIHMSVCAYSDHGYQSGSHILW
jgi:hypothetical protein